MVEGSPAHNSNVMSQDHVVEINGVDVASRWYEEVVDLLRNSGSIVRLTVSRVVPSGVALVRHTISLSDATNLKAAISLYFSDRHVSITTVSEGSVAEEVRAR